MPTFKLINKTGSKVRFHIGDGHSERADLTTPIDSGVTLYNVSYAEGQFLSCGIQRSNTVPYVNEIFYNQEINGSVITLQNPQEINLNELDGDVLSSDVSGTKYSIDFQNETPDTWTLCVYQKLPDSAGLDSVSWKQTTVPPSGESGIEWNISYLAAIVDYKQNEGKGVYKAAQKKPTSLGKKWDTIFKDNTQQLVENGTTTAGQLLIENHSEKLANLAIGMDGNIALVKKNVYSGNNAQFAVKPQYWVALYTNLTQGEVISGNQIHGPIEVIFGRGQTSKTFIAKIDGDTFIFGEEGSGNQLSVSYSQAMSLVRMDAENRT